MSASRVRSSAFVMSLMEANVLAASTTWTPSLRSSRANGIMPRTTSAPALSTNMMAFVCALDPSLVTARSRSSTIQGLGSCRGGNRKQLVSSERRDAIEALQRRAAREAPTAALSC
eukprot:scaffold50_cov420-Prasinococcus_capsulatus_cf.AAC.31